MSKQLQEALKSIDAGRIALPRDSLWDIAYSNAAKLPPLDILQPSAEILKTLDAARISLPKPLLPPPINGGIAPASYGGGEAAAEPPARESATRITSSGDLGRLIRKAREDRNLSQQSFADLAGVGRRFVSELENGKATLEFDKVLKVAHAAGISIFAKLR
ncbi:helix-turn-helix transcriptional regulator [Agrobacterium rhizogenes]|nr:helix-turn-helix transcriptional regulator [Rhizobium rhizogenes]NTG25526.1 helix-turn-helix transcriptional regulator [Rhizobium rhizogenes]NTH23457.1 helix-turn-helix transcriptional regulator [Rhizobium rhizogenes]